MPNIPSNTARITQPSFHIDTMPDASTEECDAPSIVTVISGARLAGNNSTKVAVVQASAASTLRPRRRSSVAWQRLQRASACASIGGIWSSVPHVGQPIVVMRRQRRWARDARNDTPGGKTCTTRAGGRA
nr:hypothetical protein [Burkholderia vietnamiensis]